MADLHRAGSTNKLKGTFEKKIEEANAPPGKKEKVWTPHADDQYQKQTKSQVAGGPPPKKKITDLP
jgi:hypothetical protein